MHPALPDFYCRAKRGEIVRELLTQFAADGNPEPLRIKREAWIRAQKVNAQALRKDAALDDAIKELDAVLGEHGTHARRAEVVRVKKVRRIHSSRSGLASGVLLDPSEFCRCLDLRRRGGVAAAVALLDEHAGQLPHVVTIRAGAAEERVFLVDLLRDTGTRFLHTLLEQKRRQGGDEPGAHAVVELSPDDVPAADVALALFSRPPPEALDAKAFVDVVHALTFCNANAQLAALGGALALQSCEGVLEVLEGVFSVCPSPELRASIAGALPTEFVDDPENVVKIWDILTPHVTAADCAAAAARSYRAWVWLALGVLVCKGDCVADATAPGPRDAPKARDAQSLMKSFLLRCQAGSKQVCACFSRTMLRFSPQVGHAIELQLQSPTERRALL